MRSINIKRAAAVAAGAAMIAGAISPVVAAVNVAPDQATVTSLVNNIKNNLSDTQVVIGAASKAIDSVQGAKIAAVLASLNYKQTTIETSTPTVTVNVEGTTVESNDNTRYIELTPQTSTEHYDATIGSQTTITKEVMKDVLSQKTLQISDDSSGLMAQHTYYYEDKIILGTGFHAKYSEDTNGNDGHGLYLKTQNGDIKYKIVFTGSGIPVGSSVTYQTTPEIKILGNKYGLDYANTEDGTLAFYTGTKQMINTGDTITTTDGIQVEFLSGTGTDNAQGYFKIIGTSGSETETGNLTGGSTFSTTVDGTKVTLKVESIGYNAADSSYTAQIRLGTGTQTYEAGNLFPGQTDWKVDDVEVSNNKLISITLKYDGSYLGTYSSGLAKGEKINGPLKADGTPLFTVGLEGIGSQTTTYYTTDLTFKGQGTSDDTNEMMQVKWYSKDGVLQDFKPEYPTEANFTVANFSDQVSANWTNATQGITLYNQDANSHISRWTIINDKVVYLEDVSKNTDDSTYSVKFRIADKDNGDVVEYSGITNATNKTLTYSSTHNAINCTFEVIDLTGSVGRKLVQIANDSTTGCTLGAYSVPFGKQADMSTGYTMNLHSIVAPAGTADPIATITTNASTGDSLTVGYEDHSSDANMQSGMYVTGATTFINQTGENTYTYDKNMYDITNRSTEIDGSTVGTVKITVPSAARHSLIKIAGQASTSGLGEQTLKEGDKVNGVTIEKINYPSVAEGTYYTQVASGLQPQDLVVLDTEGPSATYKIVVGGYYVNELAAAMTCGQDLKVAGDSTVCAEGNSLLVAGYEGTDTAAATDKLISLLTA